MPRCAEVYRRERKERKAACLAALGQCWPVLKVASELRMNPATVYIIGFRLTKQLKVEVERLRAEVG